MYIQKYTYICSNFEVMRTIISFILVIFLTGCEKYDTPTYPQLSGQWKLDGIQITESGSTGEGSYFILKDTVILQDFKPININGNIIRFSQSYNDPNLEWFEKFIVGKTVWEFETDIVGIPKVINGRKDYESYSRYYPVPDLISRQWNSFTIVDKNRNIVIKEYGLRTIRLTLPKVWTMFRRNTNIEFFFQNTVTLTFVRL